MSEFIKVCATIGVFTLYFVLTCAPGMIGYRVLKHTTAEKPIDFAAAAKSMLISYAIGLIAFVWVVTYFVIVRG